MRVLVVPKWYPWPERPVFGIFCREHARALAGAHDVVVLASEAVPSPPFALFTLHDGIEDGLRTLRLRYRRPRFRPAAMAVQILGMLVALARLRREGWRPEIVHAHVFSAGLPALVLGRLSRAPVVITEHFTWFQRGMIGGYDRLTARLAFRFADLVAPVSADLGRHILALAPRARIRVVPNVVDTEAFHPPVDRARGAGAGPARLLTVASLSQKKGHGDLLAALVQLRERESAPAVALQLVGEGELRGELERTVARLGLSDAVMFDGERPKEEVARLMREADLFVLPSRFENLPCVLIEAMASGLPAVATAVGGVPELLDGTGAVLCPPEDPGALADAIVTGLADRDDVDPAALSAQARSRFGYETICRTWTEIYAVLRSGSSSAGISS
jgi:glycosyltransferase involved in cell wall biosynthesis